jgi:hypothetical protein
MTVKSIMINENDGEQSPQQQDRQENTQQKTISTSANVSMMPVQNRQVFRGVQVNEENLRKYESERSVTKSCKSPPKVKLPLNYLAVG